MLYLKSFWHYFLAFFILVKNRSDTTFIYLPPISYLIIERKFGAKYAASKKKAMIRKNKNINFTFLATIKL